MEWNEEQLEIINATDNNVLASASAGCGKTTVMKERVIKLIEKGVNFDEILMVAFNDAIAKELRQEMENTIIEKCAVSNDAHLRIQIDRLPLAKISTLHSFCNSIIKENFQHLDINPKFCVISETEAEMLKEKVLNNLIDFDNESKGKVLENIYYFLQPDEFKKCVYDIFNQSVASKNREVFLENLKNEYQKELTETKFYEYIIAEVIKETRRIVEEMENDFNLIKGVESAQGLYENSIKICNEIVSGAKLERLQIILLSLKELGKQLLKDFKLDKQNDIKAIVKNQLGRIKNYFKVSAINIIIKKTSKDYEKLFVETKIVAQEMIKIVELFLDGYNREKALINALDFNDLEYYMLTLLENDAIREDLKTRFKYVCVDEYQDVNDAQESILSAISNGKNYFMVGDSKQSIYKFRQADTSIFLNKFERFLSDNRLGYAKTLNYNYRSDPRLLNEINKIFNVIMTKDFGGINYKSSSQLVGKAEYKVVSDIPPLSVALIKKEINKETFDLKDLETYDIVKDKQNKEKSTAKQEGLFIANKIYTMLGKEMIYNAKKKLSKAVEFNDIAILISRRSARTNEILNTLLKCGLPINTSNINAEALDKEIDLINDFLRVIDNPCQDFPLFNIMQSYFGGFDLKEIALIKKQNKKIMLFDCIDNFVANNDNCIDSTAKNNINCKNNIVESNANGISKIAANNDNCIDSTAKNNINCKNNIVESNANGISKIAANNDNCADSTAKNNVNCKNIIVESNANGISKIAANNDNCADNFVSNNIEKRNVESIESIAKNSVDSIDNIELSKVELSNLERFATYKSLIIKLKDFLITLEKYSRMSKYMSVYDVVKAIVKDFKYDIYLNSISTSNNLSVSLNSFLSKLKDNSVAQRLPNYIYAIENYRFKGNKSVIQDENKINVFTIHASKGLEFPIVFAINMSSQFILDTEKSGMLLDKDLGITFASFDTEERTKECGLDFQVVKYKKNKESAEESLRLMYVALTRAKSHLFLTGEGDFDKFGQRMLANNAMMNFINNAIYTADVSINVENIIETEESEAQKKDIVYYKSNKDFLKNMTDYFEFKYPFMESVNTRFKHTVSSIMRDEYSKTDIFSETESPYTAYNFKKESDVDRIKKGTLTHKVLENISFEICCEQDIKIEVMKMVENNIIAKEDLKYIDFKEIEESLNSDIIKYASKYPNYREKSFVWRGKASELLDTNSDDFIVVQGAIDLIVLGKETGGKNILVDYKRSNKTDEELIATYKKQLEIYIRATESGMDIKIDEGMIYLIGQNRTVKVF